MYRYTTGLAFEIGLNPSCDYSDINVVYQISCTIVPKYLVEYFTSVFLGSCFGMKLILKLTSSEYSRLTSMK